MEDKKRLSLALPTKDLIDNLKNDHKFSLIMKDFEVSDYAILLAEKRLSKKEYLLSDGDNRCVISSSGLFGSVKIKDGYNNYISSMRPVAYIESNEPKIQFGEFPDNVVSSDLGTDLESLYQLSKLDVVDERHDISPVFTYKGKKYCRLIAKEDEKKSFI